MYEDKNRNPQDLQERPNRNNHDQKLQIDNVEFGDEFLDLNPEHYENRVKLNRNDNRNG